MHSKKNETPQLPSLSKETIQWLKNLCFRENTAHIPSIDCLFVFGSALALEQLSKTLISLMQSLCLRRLLITGGIVNQDGMPKHTTPQALMIYHAIERWIPKNVEVILEKDSQNTYENVLFGLSLLSEPPTSFCFLAKSYHCGRAYLTLKRFVENMPIFQRSYDPIILPGKQPLSVNNWHEYPEFISTVWGEFLRIKKYGEQGDISLDEVKELVSLIEERLK